MVYSLLQIVMYSFEQYNNNLKLHVNFNFHVYLSCLYILEINPLSVVSFAIIFLHFEGCLFTLFMISFAV